MVKSLSGEDRAAVPNPSSTFNPLPSPTFIPAPHPHPTPLSSTSLSSSSSSSFTFNSSRTSNGSGDPSPLSPMNLSRSSSSSSSPATSITSVFSPSYQSTPAPFISPSAFSLVSPSVSPSTSSPPRRRKDPLLPPHSWVNSETDYIPLIPISLITLLTLYVLYLCLPTHQQFLTTFSNSPSPLTPFHLWLSPHTRPPLPSTSPPFLSRNRQLQSLQSHLSSSHTATLIGPQGSGRTSLALAYIQRLLSLPPTPPPNVILVLTASSPAALTADLSLLHASLHLPLLTGGDRGLRESIQTFLGGFARYLVVFDDCGMEEEEMRGWLPKRKGKEGEGLIGDVIFIKEGDIKGVKPSPGVVHVGSLAQAPAVQLLVSASGGLLTNDSRGEWEALAESLHRLPQSLVLAGLFMQQQGMGAVEMDQVVRRQLDGSMTPLRAVVRAVLSLPQFNSSREALSLVSLLCDHRSSSLPLVLLPPSFPLSLFAQYGLLHSTQHSFPYAYFHHWLFSTTESKTESIHLLKALIDTVRSSTPHIANHPLDIHGLIAESSFTDVVATEALSFLYRPYHKDLHVKFELGAPSLPLYPFPPLPHISLSSFYALRSLSPSASTLIHSVFGPSSSPSSLAYSRAQAAAILPALDVFLHPYRNSYGNATVQSSAKGYVTDVVPLGLVVLASLPVSVPLVHLFLVVACYNADVKRDYPAVSRDLVLASALSLHLKNVEVTAQALLLLSAYHMARNDHNNARSFLSYVEQKLRLSPASYSPALHADINSALAASHLMKGGTAAVAETAFTSAMASRQLSTDPSAVIHLLTCRDLLLRPPSSSLTAHMTCEGIETAVFGLHSYAMAGRSLSLAHLYESDNVTQACIHAVQAMSSLQSLSTSPGDYRLPLTVLHLTHLLTLLPSVPPLSPSPVPTARATLDSLFSLHASYPRGAGVYSPILLTVASEVLVKERDWLAAMDVIRQGYEVVRGRGDGDEGWRQLFSFVYNRAERDKAEERKREEERERQQKQSQIDAEQTSKTPGQTPRTDL